MRKDSQVTVQIPNRPPVDPPLKRDNSYNRDDLPHFLSLGEKKKTKQESAPLYVYVKVLEPYQVWQMGYQYLSIQKLL